MAKGKSKVKSQKAKVKSVAAAEILLSLWRLRQLSKEWRGVDSIH
jgi:hypothetical protein